MIVTYKLEIKLGKYALLIYLNACLINLVGELSESDFDGLGEFLLTHLQQGEHRVGYVSLLGLLAGIASVRRQRMTQLEHPANHYL